MKVDELIARAEEFGRNEPKQSVFVSKWIALVRKIDSEFSGEARGRLMVDAQSTFERQLEIVENAARAREALVRLEEQQMKLIDTLTELAMMRPPTATLH